MGAAISDYHHHGRAEKLRVCSTLFDEDEIPVDYLFRSFSAIPPLEQKALAMARGRVLDVGAGAGCHSLALQERGIEVVAIDISPLSCEVMQERGVKCVNCCNVADGMAGERFDTILLLMNGIGIAGTLSRLPHFLTGLKKMLAPGGQIITDSSDLKYLFDEDEDVYPQTEQGEAYYGEVDYQMIYRDTIGAPFDWLYVDFGLLQRLSRTVGFNCQLIAEGEHYDYLAKLTEASGD